MVDNRTSEWSKKRITKEAWIVSELVRMYHQGIITFEEAVNYGRKVYNHRRQERLPRC
jgi:hypothetical protein